MGLDQLADEHGLVDIGAVIREQTAAAPHGPPADTLVGPWPLAHC